MTVLAWAFYVTTTAFGTLSAYDAETYCVKDSACALADAVASDFAQVADPAATDADVAEGNQR